MEYFYPRLAGGELVSWKLANALHQRGHQLYVVTSRIPNTIEHESINGIEIFRPFRGGAASSIVQLPGRLFFAPRLCFFLNQFLRQHHIDIIYNYAYSPTIVATWSAASKDIPVITAVHSLGGTTWFQLTNPFLATFNYLQEVFVLRFGKHDAIVCPSREVTKKVQLYTKARVFTIPNPLDLDEISQVKQTVDTESIRRGLGIVRDEQFLLFVGSLSRTKNIAGLVEVLGRSDAKFKLVIVGEGSERSRVETLTRELGLAGRVKLLGQKPHRETLGIMKSCDVLVLPSRSEAFSLVVVEALALGRPVIATAVGVISEIKSANLYVVRTLEEIKALLEKGIQPKKDNLLLEEYAIDKIAEEFENILQGSLRH